MKAALPTKPVVFMKPTSSYVQEGQPILVSFYITWTLEGLSSFDNLSFGLLDPARLLWAAPWSRTGVVIGAKAVGVHQDKAMDVVAGYCLALDMTARDFQLDCKNKGLPWEIAKAFDTSCPIGEFIPKDQVPDPHSVDLWYADFKETLNWTLGICN